jgi:predicted carbohydrate-binding protein with CBM5 and CBM33 domain
VDGGADPQVGAVEDQRLSAEHRVARQPSIGTPSGELSSAEGAAPDGAGDVDEQPRSGY